MMKRLFKKISYSKTKKISTTRKNSDVSAVENDDEKVKLISTNYNKSESERIEEYDDLSFIVDYIGSDYVSEAQSVPLLMETLKRIKKQHHKTIRVDLLLKSGVLKVIDTEQRGALLITAPLYAIALVAQEQLRGFESAFALNITRRRIHMCHVFQAGSRLEAAAIVRAIALSFRSVAKDLKEKHENIAIERFRSDSERAQSDSDGFKNKNIETEAGRDSDTSTKRHKYALSTVPSEENIDENRPEEVVSVLVHQAVNNLNKHQISITELEDIQIGNIKEIDDTKQQRVETGGNVSLEKSSESGIIDLCDKAVQAIQQHDLKLLQRCIDEGLSVDSLVQSTQLSLLHHAVINNNPEITKFLLKKGADVNKEGPKDQTPLHFAAAQGNRAIALVLLAHGANVRATDSQFHTPLHLCASCLQSLEVSCLLVEHGARIEDNDIEGVRPVDLHHDLREMQNRLIQCHVQAFTTAEIDRSRSDSNCSSTSSSFKSVSRSPNASKNVYNRPLRSASWRLRASSSLQSIQDVDGDSLSPFSLRKSTGESLSTLSTRNDETSGYRIQEKQSLADKDLLTGLSSLDSFKQSDQEDQISSFSRRDSTTDSEFEGRKGMFFSDDGHCSSESDDEMKNMRDIIDQKTLHPNRLSIPGTFAKISSKNTLSTALELLVTLSANTECQSSILAHLCLPKPSQQLINLGHSVVATNNNLQQIARLLHNLFTVSGPSGRKKCIDAGLLKTVVDLLDAAEPVQSTCLSILNDMFQTENERDYSGTMSSIPIEPLLTIIKNNEPAYINDVIIDQNPLNDKMKTRISRSSDSGYPNSPALVERSSSLRKRNEDSDSSDMGTGLSSYSHPRSKLIKTEQTLPSSLENMGRGRSRSFSSSMDTVNSIRDSSPSVSSARMNARHSDAEISNSHFNSRIRRISKGSNGSVETSSKSSTSSTVVARHVAMKMLAASSRSYKLQQELAKPQILKLLLDCLDDRDDEIILQSTETLANIAMNIETHLQLQVENIEEGLFKLLNHPNLRIQYQASRGLIYLGHLDVSGKYMYSYITDDDPAAIYMEEEGRSHIRGTTVENLILTLTTTKDIYLLWGGSHALPPSPNQRKSSSRHSSNKSRSKALLSESQIINFILTTYQTFVHPIIFMRLLLHRFREPNAYKSFSTIFDDGDAHMEHYAPLPIIHARLMRVWIAWLENHSDDFAVFPTLKDELSVLIAPMRSIDGPYTPCANKLEKLLAKANETSLSNINNAYNFESENHHNILYEQCYKAIKEGKLPCAEDDLVYLVSLQLYIEDICLYGQDFPQRLKTIESITATRLKHNFSSSILSSKHIVKKIRSQYEMILSEQPTERNAKHNFVDCCQGMSGHGCTFFKVKQRIPSSRSKKKIYISRLFGISVRRIVLLDDRTKICVEKFNPKHLMNKWDALEDSLTIRITFKAKNLEKDIEIQLDNRLGFKELSNHILTCRMELKFLGYQNIDNNPWSPLAEELGTWGNMALQLHSNKQKRGNGDINQDEWKRCRSTTTTAFPMTGPTRSTIVSSSAPKHYSHSAPAKQEASGWGAYEVLSFLNLRGIIRSRGGTNTPGSASNSEAGTPPSKDGILGDSFSTTPPSNQTVVSFDTSQRRGSRVSNIAVHENTPMLDDGLNDQRMTTEHSETSKYGTKMLTCHCPQDADFSYLNLRDFSAFELLDHPKELARQITLIDHKMFCAITSKDILLKISLGSIKRYQKAEAHVNVEKIAHRFNQMSNWIVNCIVSEHNIYRRAKLFKNFIETAKQCLELRNYNAVTAIVVAALGSAPVRRLVGTKELIEPEYLGWMQKMESLMDSHRNHKKYRETLRTSQTPAVPYFGIYLKDLTFISDGNPDYLKGGVINLSKRRQVYSLLEEIRRFQRKRYNFQEVSEIRDYLTNKSFVSEEQLHQMSKKNEPAIQSRFGSSNQPVSHYQYSDRRGSSTNLFRYSTNSRTSSRSRQHKASTSV